MHSIKTSTGAEIALDGDLLAIMETLYREVTAKRDLDRSFEDMLHTVKYENDKLEAYMRKIAK
jgi:hypothetical protein